jgi:hypothetical protein
MNLYQKTESPTQSPHAQFAAESEMDQLLNQSDVKDKPKPLNQTSSRRLLPPLMK